MIIIPAIDIIEGKCVRLSQGNFAHKTIYNNNPLEVAKSFEDAGITRLHLVDLDGARQGKVVNWQVLKTLASESKLRIDFSGGIQSDEDIKAAFEYGSTYISIGSMAVKNGEKVKSWIRKFGEDKFIIGADVNKGKVVIKGWTEQTELSASELITKYKRIGIRQFFCTDVEKDGQMMGPSTTFYKQLLNEHPSINLIASGGVRNTEDLIDLQKAGCYGVIIGKALYEKSISLDNLKQFL